MPEEVIAERALLSGSGRNRAKREAIALNADEGLAGTLITTA